MSERQYDSDDLLSNIQDQSLSPASREEVERQRQEKEQQLLKLKRMQEQLEKETRELEEFTVRKDEFQRGLAEVLSRLQRSMVILERTEFEAQRRGEEVRRTREIFQTHLQELSQFENVTWSNLDQKKDLTKALTLVENARGDYAQAEVRLSVLSEMEDEEGSVAEEVPESGDFGRQVVSGLAQNLGLIVAILVLAAAILLKQ